LPTLSGKLGVNLLPPAPPFGAGRAASTCPRNDYYFFMVFFMDFLKTFFFTYAYFQMEQLA
jgi:hypothetical protein